MKKVIIASQHVNRLTRPISSFCLTWWIFSSFFGKIWKVMLVSVFEQYATMYLIFNIWFSNGCWRLSIAVDLFTVPPMPSHGDFPWLVAKKRPWCFYSKIFYVHKDCEKIFWHWSVYPSLKYSTNSNCEIVFFRCWIVFSWIKCTITTSCNNSSERKQRLEINSWFSLFL